MSYLALYRRYRPNTFNNLIGQDHIVKTLVNQIKYNRLGHAYLFTGTRGTGKTSAAKIFAKAINCENNINGSPCGKCATCLALSDSANLDIIEIDAASNNGVNEIRDLREKVQYPPVSGKYKVYIIDEVHMLTGAAFNALLKTLEEPPHHAVFILATTEVHKIPATILSRCMRFDFRLVSVDLIAKLIMEIYNEQGKEYETEAVYQIAKAGEGSIRDALSIADTALSYSNKKLTFDEVNEILGSSNTEVLINFLTYVLNGETGKVLESIEKFSAFGKSIGVLIKDITRIIRDLIVIKTCENSFDILKLPKSRYDELKNLANAFEKDRLIRILEIFAETENALRYSNQPRIVFETASLKASRSNCDYNLDALLARVKSLENLLANGVQQKNIVTEKNQTIPNVQKQERKELSMVTSLEVMNTLIKELGKNNKEMLCALIPSTTIKVSTNEILIITKDEGDLELLSKEDNRKSIENALSIYMPFTLKMLASNLSKGEDAFYEETENIKKIFGDDIVIIK